MRMIFLIISLFTFLTSCSEQSNHRKEAYSYLNIEVFPRDSVGKIKGTPIWKGPYQIKPPLTAFEIYGNYDSIKMITPDVPTGDMFRKFRIEGYKWKPRPDYGKKFFFLDTYTADHLPGFYFSFYTTKDWKSLLQVEYTNPGNLMAVLLFSKDSINMLKKNGINIHPKDEQPEPERAVMSNATP